MSEGVRKETAWKPATGGIEFKSGSWLKHKTALKMKCGLYFFMENLNRVPKRTPTKCSFYFFQ